MLTGTRQFFPETLFQVSTLGLMLEGHVMGRSSASFKHPLNCGNTLLQGSPLSFQVPHKHSRQHSKPPLLCQPAGKADRELLVSHSKSHQSRHTLKGGWAQFCLVFFFFFPLFPTPLIGFLPFPFIPARMLF